MAGKTCDHTTTDCKLGKNMGNHGLKLSKYSIGTGDRFAHQAKAQGRNAQPTSGGEGGIRIPRYRC